MPNYKLVDSVQLERDLTTVADAIRGKTGSSDALVFPDGYVGAVDGLGAPDDFENGYADALSKRTDLVIAENGEYFPEGESTGFKSVAVSVVDKSTDQIIDGSITEITSNVETVRDYGFQYLTSLVSVNLPRATKIGAYALHNCKSLVSIYCPMLNSISNGTFQNSGFQTLKFTNPILYLYDQTFGYCYNLVSVDFNSVRQFAGNSFQCDYSLKVVILRGETMTLLATVASNLFKNCSHFSGTVNATYNPDGLKDGYIYVPRSLVEEYKVATNWTVYADRFRALEDYTVDGTTTGELDESKI